MTTNELVRQIKSGQNELMPQLWEHIQKFIKMQAGKKLDNYPDHLRLLQDDMINQSYFYLSQAIENYDPEKSSFLNYLNFYLPMAFSEVINGGRTARSKNEPLNNYISYETPVNDTEDLTIADTLLDETAEAYYRHLEDEDFWKDVNRLLMSAMKHINNKQGEMIVLYMFYNDCTIKQAADAINNGQYDKTAHEYYSAIADMKRHIKSRTAELKKSFLCLDDYINYSGHSLKSYKNRKFTSAVEAAAIRNADRNMEHSDILQVIS